MGVVADKLEARDPNTSSLTAWMKDWELDSPIDITRSSRHGCFAEVEKRADILLENEHLEELRYSVSSSDTATAWYDSLYRKFCLPSAQKLIRLLNNLELDHRFFVFAFDECSYLHTTQLNNRPWEPHLGASLIGLQRIIKAGDKYHQTSDVALWHLFLDTDLTIFDLAPSIPDVHSYRIPNGLMLLPPWPYLGFNQMVGGRHIQNINTPADILTLKHQKIYGRPVSNETMCTSF
jgi:hypothetical protein